MNWKIRFKNPYFIASLVLSIILPIVTYAGITMQDITTWPALFELLRSATLNPYLLATIVISMHNAVIDFTTPGITDGSETND